MPTGEEVMGKTADGVNIGNEELAVLFHRAAKMMARSYHRHSHAHHAQARVYEIIKQHGVMSQAELQQILDVRSSSLSEVLGKLEVAGVITRERNKNDRRSFIISVKDGVPPPFTDHTESNGTGVDTLFSCLKEQERNQLGRLLQKIIGPAAGDESGHRCNKTTHRHHAGASYEKGKKRKKR